MAIIKQRAFCPECDRNVLAERDNGIGDGWGCLLTILTGGLFFPLWAFLYLINSRNPYVCPSCGGLTIGEDLRVFQSSPIAGKNPPPLPRRPPPPSDWPRHDI